MVHWSACVWGFLGSPSKVGHASSSLQAHDYELCAINGPCEPGIFGSDLGTPWIRRYGLENFPADHTYLAALNFATGLITGGETAGISPGYSLERAYVVVMTILSFLVCSTIMSQIVVVISKITEDKAHLQENLRIVK